MRTGVDTNILVRLIAEDDRDQLLAIRTALAEAGKIVVSTTVLCEVVWVLGRGLKRTRAEIAQAVRFLMESETIEMDLLAANAGLSMMESGGDFSDGVVLFDAQRARCDQLLTFDRVFARIGGRPPVTLVASDQSS